VHTNITEGKGDVCAARIVLFLDICPLLLFLVRGLPRKGERYTLGAREELRKEYESRTKDVIRRRTKRYIDMGWLEAY